MEKGSVYQDLKGKILTALFYEPSSRTFGSFLSAMQRLGGGIIPIHGVAFSSVVKGESLIDTVRTFQNYSDVIVLRHPEKGAAYQASSYLQIPLINAGDGTGEHPTQALLDLLTIQNNLGRLTNLKIAIVGDLKYGRTVHSLARLLSLYKKVTFYFVSPVGLRMPESILTFLKKKKIQFYLLTDLKPIIKQIDVLYMTRIQKERMNEEVYEKSKSAYQINNHLVNQMKKEAIVMHPLPRVNEISPDVDQNPRAVYFKEQMCNGLAVRMALLRLILKA